MEFPQNAAELHAAMTQRWEKAVELGQQSATLQQQSNQLHDISFILAKLMDSWQQPDPGEYEAAYFFLQPGTPVRVVVQEFLPDGAKPRYNYPVIPFAEIVKGECPQCHQDDCPVIERYRYVRVGGLQKRIRILLCLNCNTAVVFVSKSSA